MLEIENRTCSAHVTRLNTRATQQSQMRRKAKPRTNHYFSLLVVAVGMLILSI